MELNIDGRAVAQEHSRRFPGFESNKGHPEFVYRAALRRVFSEVYSNFYVLR
jgi:hypothetical protein